MFESLNSKVILREYSSSQVAAPELASLSWVARCGSGSQMTRQEAWLCWPHQATVKAALSELESWEPWMPGFSREGCGHWGLEKLQNFPRSHSWQLTVWFQIQVSQFPNPCTSTATPSLHRRDLLGWMFRGHHPAPLGHSRTWIWGLNIQPIMTLPPEFPELQFPHL